MLAACRRHAGNPGALADDRPLSVQREAFRFRLRGRASLNETYRQLTFTARMPKYFSPSQFAAHVPDDPAAGAPL